MFRGCGSERRLQPSAIMGESSGGPGKSLAPVRVCLVWSLLVCLFCFPVAAASSGRKAPVPVVGVYTVETRDTVASHEYVGHVEAIQSVDLRARVEGFLDRVDFREGQAVKAGKLLYVIEQAPYEARVKARKADVAAAEGIGGIAIVTAQGATCQAYKNGGETRGSGFAL